jgi:hypothetical protein
MYTCEGCGMLTEDGHRRKKDCIIALKEELEERSDIRRDVVREHEQTARALRSMTARFDRIKADLLHLREPISEAAITDGEAARWLVIIDKLIET